MKGKKRKEGCDTIGEDDSKLYWAFDSDLRPI
jgi:hypothetical protein